MHNILFCSVLWTLRHYLGRLEAETLEYVMMKWRSANHASIWGKWYLLASNFGYTSHVMPFVITKWHVMSRKKGFGLHQAVILSRYPYKKGEMHAVVNLSMPIWNIFEESTLTIMVHLMADFIIWNCTSQIQNITGAFRLIRQSQFDHILWCFSWPHWG